MTYKNLFFILLISFVFFGCSLNIPTPSERKSNLQVLAGNNYIEKVESSKSFNLYSLQKVSQSCNAINIYIEGDGLSWITRSIVSPNPTPINPYAFKLMKEDKSECKIYLARPCQYTSSNICDKRYWTNLRFSEKVIDSYVEILSKIKKEYKNSSFNLIGYSGGAAIASLTANFRDDVKSLITVAGNLDINLWTRLKNISPLSGSLNPVDYVNNIQNIKQYHLIGTKDNVIPKDLIVSYKNQFKNQNNIFIELVNATHNCCYEDDFKDLINK